MKTTAFIHVRKGSKGCPGKNIRLIAGKPLVAHAIAQAKANALIDQVVVSTDCDTIAHIAKHYGADILMRSAALCTDEAPEFLSWKYAVERVECDVFVNLPATCPLRAQEDINKVIMCLDDYVQVAFTVKEVKEFIIDWHSGSPPDRRQQLPTRRAVVGSCYAATPTYIREHESIWESMYMTVDVPQERTLDIDTEYDFRLAKLLMEHT